VPLMPTLSTLPIPVSASKLSEGTRLSAFHLSGNVCLVGWLEGTRSFRAGLLDTSTGALAHPTAVKGDLVGYLADEEHLWVLTDHGLHQHDRDTMVVSGTLRTGMPKYPARMLRLGPHHALIVTKYGQSHPVIDLRSLTIERRLRVAEPEVALLSDTGASLFSFRYGRLRTLGPDMTLSKQTEEIPLGIGAICDDDRVAFVSGAPEPPAAIITRAGLDTDRFADIEPDGMVTWISTDGTISTAAENVGIARLHGRSSNRDLIGSDGSVPGGFFSVSILRPDGASIRHLVPMRSRSERLAILEDSRLLICPRIFGDLPAEFVLLEW